jgi:hypothetical protein
MAHTVNSYMNRMFLKLDEIGQIAFNQTYYVFYDGYYAPYLYSKTNSWATGSAKATLFYNYDTNVFFPYTLSSRMLDTYLMSNARSLPILSLDIIDSDEKVHYDLTDYIEKMKFIQVENSSGPSLAQIVATWTLASHIVLDSTRFSVRYINDYGDTIITGLDDMSDVLWVPDEVEEGEGAEEGAEEEAEEGGEEGAEEGVEEGAEEGVEEGAEDEGEEGAVEGESQAEVTTEFKTDPIPTVAEILAESAALADDGPKLETLEAVEPKLETLTSIPI